MTEELFNAYLDNLTKRSNDELKLARKLSNQEKHLDAHDHHVAACTIHDAILLGHGMLARRVVQSPNSGGVK